MSLKFAAITPHPPVLIPEVGSDKTNPVKNTISAMERLAGVFEQADVDTVIIVSPHSEAVLDAMTVFSAENFQGNMSDFGAPNVSLSFSGQSNLAGKIYTFSQQEKIPIIQNDYDRFLDHGVFVPMYFLTKYLGSKINLVKIAFSGLSRKYHLEFGKIILKVINNSDERIAFIASGDLSHRLFDSNYQFQASEFDQKIVKLIKDNKLKEIAEIDEEVVKSAGECGFRSMIILSGLLQDNNYKAEVLSYEAPFGIGYLVANFKLNT